MLIKTKLKITSVLFLFFVTNPVFAELDTLNQGYSNYITAPDDANGYLYISGFRNNFDISEGTYPGTAPSSKNIGTVTVVGGENKLTGLYSSDIFGDKNEVTNADVNLHGQNNKISGVFGDIMGDSNVININGSTTNKPETTTVFGSKNTVSGTNSSVLGFNTNVTSSNSVTLGNGSTNDRDNTVSVGSSGNERQITNVAAGTKDTDAVNVSQLKQVDFKFKNIYSQIQNNRDEARAGIASAMAMASMPQPYSAGKSMFALGAAGYKDQSAFSMGWSNISENGKVITKVNATTNSQGDFGVAVGLGFQY